MDFTFLTDLINSPYFIYVLIVVSVTILFLLKGFFMNKGQSNKEALREIENEAYLQGVNYLLSKDNDKAIDEFIKAVKVNSETVATYFALGTLFRNKGEYSKATRIHQSIMARPNIDPDTKSQALYNLGLDYKRGGMVQKGIEIFESISKNEKYKIDALYSLSSLYEDMKEWDNAIETLKELIKYENIDKSNIMAHLLTEKAKTLFEEGNNAEAKKIFKKAVSTFSGCIDAHLHLGDIYFSEGDYSKAIQTWKQALEINSYFTHLAYPRLEQAYFNLDMYDSIEKLLKENLEKNEKDAYCRLALGRYYFNKGLIEAAIEELKEALTIDPGFIDAKKELGNIYMQNNMIEEMKEEYKELLESFPSRYNSYRCKQCGYFASEIMWKCPQCRKWDTIIPENMRKV